MREGAVSGAVIPAGLKERVRAGEPKALREFFEDYICSPNRIAYHYTADRAEWYAQPRRRFVSVPPPADLVLLFIGLHEAAHCLIAPCAGSGHQRSDGCLECERQTWLAARQ